MLFLLKSKAAKGLSAAMLAAWALFMPANAIASATTWKGSTIASVADGTTDVFLYNVKTGKFLGKGGKWGTQAIISEVGIPFTIAQNSDGTYTLTSHAQAQGGTTLGVLGFTNGVNSKFDTYRFFTDRKADADKSYTTHFFTFTTDTPADDNEGIGENFYKISLTSKSGSSSALTGTFYMVAGTDTEFLNTEAPMGTKTEPTDDSEIWQIVSLQDRKDAFKEADFAGKNGVGATFLLHDQDFSRNQTTISYWKSDNFADQLVNGTKSCYPYQAYTTNSYTYYVGNGYPDVDVSFNKENKKTVSAKNLQEDYGHNWTANIHGANGNIAQEIEEDRIVREGWYEVTCQAFTTAKEGTVQLFASVGGATEGENGFFTVDIDKGEDMSVAQADSVTYVMAYDRLHGPTDNENAHTYKIRFRVDKENDVIEKFYFGIKVKDAEATAWTCFDNFTLKYYGNAEHNLYLDETNTDIAQIQKQAVAYDIDGNVSMNNRTLYLNRSFNLDTWNSIVLPVSLTAEQVKSAFGSSVKLSEFYGACEAAYPGCIFFKGVDLSESSATAMKAGQLYLIRPTIGMTEKKVKFNVITGTETIDGLTQNTTEAVTVEKAYIINQVNVTFGSDIKSSVTTATKGNYSEYYGDEENMVRFVGTYVAGVKIPVNSYVIAGNTSGNHVAGYWYYRTATTNTKGFRGWLETYRNLGNAKLEYFIDDVLEIADGTSTTAIDGVLGDADVISGNVYNLNGQLVRTNATTIEGLGRGIYVVNGKKYVVK